MMEEEEEEGEEEEEDGEEEREEMASISQILASRLVVVRVGSAVAGEVVQVRGEGEAEDAADDPEVGHLSLR